ncbi:MAG: hypothetical protein JWM11_2901 [Planctomycetaceae bacterium]|nr:hypothetical protein [Planctomycetaceae bacterium]
MTDRQASLNDIRVARLLQLLGVIDLLALLAVAMPLDWMSVIHSNCGLGPLPEGRIVGYLARTTSTLYALHGALILFISIDIDRYRPLIRFLACAAMAHGAILLGIDLMQGMPWFWTILEAPIFAATGIAVLWNLGWSVRS